MVLVVSIHIYAIIDAVRTSSDQVNVLPKKIWAITVFIPLVGPILWLAFGQRNAPFAESGGNYSRRSRSSSSKAPDDDPEFLRILDIKRQQREESKRLEKWHKDLEQREKKLGKDDEQNDSDSTESSLNEE